MIFLNPAVILKKIQRDDSLARHIKSFIASLAIYMILAASILYLSSTHAIPLPKSETKISISLTEFAPNAGDMHHEVQMQKNIATQSTQPLPRNKPLKPIKKTTPQKMPLKSPMASSEGPAPLNPPVAAPSTPHSTLSPHLNVSSEIKNELHRNPHSSNEVGGATLGQIRAMIENAITYPAIARKLKLEGVVLVFFILKHDGTVETVKIQSTSGSNILDQKAMQTILSLSGQYPALGKTFELSIPIAFSLKKS